MGDVGAGDEGDVEAGAKVEPAVGIAVGVVVGEVVGEAVDTDVESEQRQNPLEIGELHPAVFPVAVGQSLRGCHPLGRLPLV